MAKEAYKYVIVGGGLAGASAVSGIRDVDKEGSILLVGTERFLPYERPPLSKKLWAGKKRIEDVSVHDSEFYTRSGVELKLGAAVTAIDAAGRSVLDSNGSAHRYEKLLLATGGVPRTLDIPGGDLWNVCYYRYLDDYLRIHRDAVEERSAVVIGGGFIGSELAAALSSAKVSVTMVFPEAYLVQRVFPEDLGRALQDMYRERGVTVLNGESPVSFEISRGKWVTSTSNGKRLESDILIVGAGILPSIKPAQDAGLQVGNGIVVNEYTQTSDPDIFAAGDNALFPYIALGESMRVEHWDNAVSQGTQAGRNMAGAGEVYDYMPYFWSDLFDFGYEAVGDVNSKLEVYADWRTELDTGVIYYLKDGRVRGVMTCNTYDKQDQARELIRSGRRMTPEDLRGAISD